MGVQDPLPSKAIETNLDYKQTKKKSNFCPVLPFDIVFWHFHYMFPHLTFAPAWSPVSQLEALKGWRYNHFSCFRSMRLLSNTSPRGPRVKWEKAHHLGRIQGHRSVALLTWGNHFIYLSLRLFCDFFLNLWNRDNNITHLKRCTWIKPNNFFS